MNDLSVRLVESPSELCGALRIRNRVFVREQNIPIEEERDEDDDTAIHVIALLQGKIVGTGRVVIQDGESARIGRMAVDRGFRQHGIGGRILSLLEKEARSRGSRCAVLHAQEYIKAFYVKRGYEEHGGVFLEVDIAHVEMRKRL